MKSVNKSFHGTSLESVFHTFKCKLITTIELLGSTSKYLTAKVPKKSEARVCELFER